MQPTLTKSTTDSTDYLLPKPTNPHQTNKQLIAERRFNDCHQPSVNKNLYITAYNFIPHQNQTTPRKSHHIFSNKVTTITSGRKPTP
eukprot:gene13006-8852_t